MIESPETRGLRIELEQHERDVAIAHAAFAGYYVDTGPMPGSGPHMTIYRAWSPSRRYLGFGFNRYEAWSKVAMDWSKHYGRS